MTYFIWAMLLGGLSAASLPLGSLVGIRYKFTNRQSSFLAAFGAGALLAALSVELIAPTTLNLLETEHHQDKSAFFNMVIGCVLGGILYILLDKAVSTQGGFLRKKSTLLSYYKKEQRENKKKILNALAKNPLFHDFPSDHINELMKSLRVKKYEPGDIVVEQKNVTKEVGVIASGELEFFLNDKKTAKVSSEDIMISLLSALTNNPEIGKLIAKTESTILWIDKDDLNRFREISPSLNRTIKELAENRFNQLKEFAEQSKEEIIDWIEKSKNAMRTDSSIPRATFIRESKEKHENSPLAIWLGILLDGIPESLTIGAGMLAILTAKLSVSQDVGFIDVIPFTLIAGLFLSNFPEALSSSQNMLKAGLSKSRVFMLWFSLMIMTGIGAGVGYFIAGELNPDFMVGFQGMAAGAMLTMIAAAMIPEAVVMGTGNLVGLSTLAGFLSAILFKLLE